MNLVMYKVIFMRYCLKLNRYFWKNRQRFRQPQYNLFKVQFFKPFKLLSGATLSSKTIHQLQNYSSTLASLEVEMKLHYISMTSFKHTGLFCKPGKTYFKLFCWWGRISSPSTVTHQLNSLPYSVTHIIQTWSWSKLAILYCISSKFVLVIKLLLLL